MDDRWFLGRKRYDSSSIILRQVGEGEGSAGISLSIENADKILQFAKKNSLCFFWSW